MLIVEDDASIARLVQLELEQLEQEGALRRVVHDGEQALAALESRAEAVILDIMLPGMDGFAVLREPRRSTPQDGDDDDSRSPGGSASLVVQALAGDVGESLVAPPFVLGEDAARGGGDGHTARLLHSAHCHAVAAYHRSALAPHQ